MKKIAGLLLAVSLLAACQTTAPATEESDANDPSKPIPLGQTEATEAFATEPDGSPAEPGAESETEATADVAAPGAGVKEGAKAQFEDGEYDGTGRGNNGDVLAKVTIENGYIHTIRLEGPAETPSIFNTVIDDLAPRVIYNQTAQVDVTGGATYSSQGAIEAIQDALGKALPEETE